MKSQFIAGGLSLLLDLLMLGIGPNSWAAVERFDLKNLEPVSGQSESPLEATQPGSIDPRFKLGFDITPTSGSNPLAVTIRVIYCQQDGRILIGGAFSTTNGIPQSNLVRIFPDGSVDPSFFASMSPFGAVTAIAEQPDGRIIVQGVLTDHDGNGTAAVRLEADGTLDSTFSSSVDTFFAWYATNAGSIQFQQDGKIYIAGAFITSAGALTPGIVRLHPNGSTDETFQSGSGPGIFPFEDTIPYVSSIILLPDSRILVGGNFRLFSGLPVNNLTLLNPDGSQSSNFIRGSGPNGSIVSMVEDGTGKIVITGFFSEVNGVPRNGVARIAVDGTLDTTFDPKGGPAGAPTCIARQKDGKLLLTGFFNIFDGIPVNGIARLNLDGSLDTGFYPGFRNGLWTQYLQTVAIQRDNQILVGGFFQTPDAPTPQKWVTRLNGSDATPSKPLIVEASQNQESLAGTSLSIGVRSVSYVRPSFQWLRNDEPMPEQTNATLAFTDVKVTDSGDYKVIVSNPMGSVKSVAIQLHVQPTPNTGGATDTDFSGQAGPDTPLAAIAVQKSKKVIIGGSFTSVNGRARKYLARLNPDGTLDDTFTPDPIIDRPVAFLAADQADKIWIRFGWDNYSNRDFKILVRLNADGSLDQAFDHDSNLVGVLAVEPQGSVIANTTNGVCRVMSDGSLDSRFQPISLTAGVSSAAVQPDGKIIVAGTFESLRDRPARFIARLNFDGSLDASFVPESMVNPLFSAPLAVSSRGKILLATQNGLIRLNCDGSSDAGFQANLWGGTGQLVLQCLAVGPDDSIMVGGDFSLVNGIPRHNVARLKAGDFSMPVSILIQPQGQSLKEGQNLILTAAATSVECVIYQWTHNGAIVSGANSRTLSIENARTKDAGDYSVIVSTEHSQTNSSIAHVEIETAPGGPGTVDVTFRATPDPGQFFGSPIALQSDGRLIVTVKQREFQFGEFAAGMMRLFPNGTRDTSFRRDHQISSSTGVPTLSSIKILGDDMVVSGAFTDLQGQKRNGVARLLPNGDLDPGFVPGFVSAERYVSAIAIQPDRKIVVGRSWRPYAPWEGLRHLTRFNADGSDDSTFDFAPSQSLSHDLRQTSEILVLPDQSIFVCGDFDHLENKRFGHFAKIQNDGGIDENFLCNPGADDTGDPNGYHIIRQNDGKILVGGGFYQVHGIDRRNIARLNPDGTVDQSFDAGLVTSNGVTALALQSDGRIVAAFTSIIPPYGRVSGNIIRLEPTGAIDPTFQPITDILGAFNQLAISGDKLLYASGSFSEVNGIPRSNLIRIHLSEASELPRIRNITVSEAGISIQIETQAAQLFQLEAADFLAPTPQWQIIQSVAGDGNVKSLIDASGKKTQRFYRIQMK